MREKNFDRWNSVFFRRLRLLFLLMLCQMAMAEDGYRLWLRYEPVGNTVLREEYLAHATEIVEPTNSPTQQVIRSELECGFSGLLGKTLVFERNVSRNGALVIGTPANNPSVAALGLNAELKQLGPEGFLIRSITNRNYALTVIASEGEQGTLYGTFDFLRRLQTHQSIKHLNIAQKPMFQRRLLNHWDNLNGSVERGYAGKSLWNWKTLPDTSDSRYQDYARADASIGINGAVLNNVNASPKQLSTSYVKKAAALADVFRPYGIRVYLTANFASPKELGDLATADPRDPAVIKWWKDKADEIYRVIPDFGGFLVKANSEGQPGPQKYGCTHADGANLLASALAPHGGVVMWRAFVYESMGGSHDRATEAYKEFKPLDGKFDTNVYVQIKNGPIDFQPREMFHPLFGAMPKTSLLAELQITQEYLGHSTDLVYLAPMWKEFLDSDTYVEDKGSTVAKMLLASPMTCIAGVANIGRDQNWCGANFAQANWYAFGRLAWNCNLTADQIAKEWIRMTWGNDPKVVSTIGDMMRGSWDACVNYEMPIGLTDLEEAGSHYGPDPARHQNYHQADAEGIGYDRGTNGSDAISEYAPEVAAKYGNLATCPDNLLLWFHHVSWDYEMKSGRTVWEELCFRYNAGVEYVKEMQKEWESLRGKIDPERFDAVQKKLRAQLIHATNWRNTCIRFFQSVNHKPLPAYLSSAAQSEQ